MLETSDEWITTRTGMQRRHIAADNEATSDLAVAAARRALLHAGITAQEIDCTIVATATPDYLFPATACIVSAALGVVGKPAFDLEIACSGFVYGLAVAASLVRAGLYRRVLLIGAEKLSAVTDMTDRTTAILFADGAGAVIVERSLEDAFLGCDLGADGRQPELLYIPGGGIRRDPGTDPTAKPVIKMQGREVFKFAVTKMVESSQRALAQAGLTTADCTYLVPHQANRRIIDLAAKQLDLDPDRVLINIEEYGNTSAASIPLVLSEAVEAGRFRSGDVLVFTGFGGGLSWGAVVWRWLA